MVERGLRRRNVGVVALPDGERRLLQGASVRERELPRSAPLFCEHVELVEVRGRLDIALATGKKRDAGNRGGNAAQEHRQAFLRDLVNGGALPGFLSRNDHARLQDHLFELYVRAMQFVEDVMQRALV